MTLKMKTTWIQYMDWKRKIDVHFNYVEKLATNDIQRRIIRLHDTMDSSWINHLNQEIQANNVVEWEQVVAILERRMDQLFPKMRRIIAAVTLTQKNGEDLVAFTNRLKIALDSVGFDSWSEDKKKAIDLFQRITDKKLKDKCMEKTKNDVDKLTWDFIMNMDQTLRSGSRDAWEPTGDYGYIDKGVSSNKSNNNANKSTPRVAKAADSAPKQKKDPPRKKRFDTPCGYCVANEIPEHKRYSHQEHKCKFKDGTYKWVPPQAQAAAAPQAQAQAPRPAGRVDQGTDAAIDQEQPTQEQREGAVRDYFNPYLQNSLPDEMTAGASNANREGRISAVRHSARKRREEQIKERISRSEEKEKNESTAKPVSPDNVIEMSSSDDDEEDTEDEDKPSAAPELSDTDDSDNDEGNGNCNDSGRSSPEQQDFNKGSKDNESNQDPKEQRGHNGGYKYRLPGLISPGDSGIEDFSDSEFEDVEEEDQMMSDDHFKGTAYFEEYFDVERNRPGSTTVEESETKCK